VKKATKAVSVTAPSPLAGEGSSLLLQVLMGEGVDCENPSPIRIRAHTIVPSPARGEGTKAHASRWRMLAKRSHVAS